MSDANADVVLPGDNSAESVILDDPTETTDLKPADSPDPSPETGDNQPEKISGSQKRINTLTYEKHEAKRENDRLKAELEDAKAAKPAAPAPSPTTDIAKPVLPEDLDDREEMEKYHNEVLAYSGQVADAAAKTALEGSKKTDQETASKAEHSEVVSGYTKKAIEDGVDIDKLRAGENMLKAGGITPELGRHIMTDPNGGKIVEYLHDNPDEMDSLLALGPIAAGIKIESVIKQKALANMPNITNTPEPIPDISGTGALLKDTFEQANPTTEFI